MKSESKLVSRRENRAVAMQFAYMRDLNSDGDIALALEDFFQTKDKPRQYYAFAEELVAGVEAHIKDIDEAISKAATNWPLSRIAKVDLAVLRVAVFELLFRDDIPPVVSINEAIDLAKTYSTAESRRFINGVLDSVKASLKRPLRTANEVRK